MGSIDILKPLSTLLDAVPSINPSNIKKFQRKTFRKAENWTWGCWVSSKNATLVLCSPLPHSSKLEKSPTWTLMLPAPPWTPKRLVMPARRTAELTDLKKLWKIKIRSKSYQVRQEGHRLAHSGRARNQEAMGLNLLVVRPETSPSRRCNLTDARRKRLSCAAWGKSPNLL